MEPGGSWMEAARFFSGCGRPADAGRERSSRTDSKSSRGATGGSRQDGEAPWHLPLCDRVGVDRDGAESRIVHNYLLRSRAVEVAPLTGYVDSVKEHSQANPSCPEGDIFDSLCGFSRFPRRRAADGAGHGNCSNEALPNQATDLGSL